VQSIEHRGSSQKRIEAGCTYKSGTLIHKHTHIHTHTHTDTHEMSVVTCSVNMKERLDFSCALFGPEGSLIANAPHLPVHLGAMSDAVKFQVCMCGYVRV